MDSIEMYLDIHIDIRLSREQQREFIEYAIYRTDSTGSIQ